MTSRDQYVHMYDTRSQELEEDRARATETIQGLREELAAVSTSNSEVEDALEKKNIEFAFVQSQAAPRNNAIARLTRQLAEVKSQAPLVEFKLGLPKDDLKHPAVEDGDISGHRADGDADTALIQSSSGDKDLLMKQFKTIYMVTNEEYAKLTPLMQCYVDLRASFDTCVPSKDISVMHRESVKEIRDRLDAMGDITEYDGAEEDLSQLAALIECVIEAYY